ncbi:MAG: hypothetical protein ACLR84_05355 [Clostridia bacterium]
MSLVNFKKKQKKASAYLPSLFSVMLLFVL